MNHNYSKHRAGVDDCSYCGYGVNDVFALQGLKFPNQRLFAQLLHPWAPSHLDVRGGSDSSVPERALIIFFQLFKAHITAASRSS